MTYKQIVAALIYKGYPNYLVKDQADWIFENYYVELNHLRPIVFWQTISIINQLTEEQINAIYDQAEGV